MKKLLCLVLLVSVLSLSVVAFADQTYTGDGYSFQFPDTWSFGIDQEGLEFVLMISDGYSNINLSIADIGMNVTAEQFDLLFVPILIQNYQTVEEFESITILEKESPIVLGDNTFSTLCFNASILGIDLYMEQYVVISGTVAYVFTVSYVNNFINTFIYFFNCGSFGN